MFYLLFFGRSVLLVSPFSLVLCLYGLEYYEVPELDISCIYLYIPLFIYASCLFYVYLSMFMYFLFLCIYFIYLLVCFVLYFFKFHLRQGNSLKETFVWKKNDWFCFHCFLPFCVVNRPSNQFLFGFTVAKCSASSPVTAAVNWWLVCRCVVCRRAIIVVCFAVVLLAVSLLFPLACFSLFIYFYLDFLFFFCHVFLFFLIYCTILSFLSVYPVLSCSLPLSFVPSPLLSYPSLPSTLLFTLSLFLCAFISMFLHVHMLALVHACVIKCVSVLLCACL